MGYSPLGHKRIGHDLVTKTASSLYAYLPYIVCMLYIIYLLLLCILIHVYIHMKVKVALSCLTLLQPHPCIIQSMEFSRPEYWSG